MNAPLWGLGILNDMGMRLEEPDFIYKGDRQGQLGTA